MNLTIFGGTGEAGQMLIERAINESHQVTVYARDPEKVELVHQNLTIIRGELDDIEGIDAAIAGADAVISLLRPVEKAEGTPIADGTARIINSMNLQGVRRLVALSSPGARSHRDRISARFAIMNLIDRLFLTASQDDLIQAAIHVEQSDLDWTIVRVPIQTSDEGKGRIRAGYIGQKRLGTSITRDDLVEFVLDLVVTGDFHQQSPIVTN
jgi:putative NADH-flavin reductase